MSRSRPITTPHGDFWIDREANGQKAKHDQLEILAAMLDVSIDDVLDEFLTQGQVVGKIRELQGQIPPKEVIERREIARFERQIADECRVCGREGDSTQHHFVPKWLMRELEDYEKYAPRLRCTIPVCLTCHRALHMRVPGKKSIAPYLNQREREFAHHLLTEVRGQHPVLFDLLMGGDPAYSYEAQLVHDFVTGRIVALMKTCSKCKETKLFEEFHRNRTGRFGRAAQCKVCRITYNRGWRKRNSQSRRDYQAEYRRRNPELIKAQAAKLTSDDHRRGNLKSKYGLTVEEFNQILANQDGRCACCSAPFGEGKDRAPHVDHCHTTGLVRGLLCIRCNSGIGLLGDSIEGLDRARKYLGSSEPQSTFAYLRVV